MFVPVKNRVRMVPCGRHFITVFSLFFTICLTAGCGGEDPSTGATHSTKPIQVKTCAVQAVETGQPIMLSGMTEPVHRVTPAARIMARVVEAGFREGDRVEAGRILVRLDTRDLLARKKQARAAVETTSTALEVARMNLERMRNLKKSETVSSNQLESAEVVYAQANAASESAISGLEEIDVNLSYSIAHAPFPGIIVRKLMEVGDMVAPGQPLFIIESDSHLRVITPVSTDLTTSLKPGQKLQVRMGQETVQGTIEGIVSSGSTDAPGLRVQLIIDNAGLRFKAGTLAVVEVPHVGSEVVCISVSKDALIEKGRLTGVYVVTRESKARLHWLILGENKGVLINVISGLREGDRVILFPEKAGVKDGIPVKEINP